MFRFDTDSILKFIDEMSEVKECSLAVLKFGDMLSNVDNVCKFIRMVNTSLSNLRYCEVVSKTVVTDTYGNIEKLIKHARVTYYKLFSKLLERIDH